VFLHRKKGGLPALHIVTGRALTAVRAFRKLSFMGILVAVRTLLELERLFEIPIGVALSALDRSVLAFQRVLCLGMVELLVDALHRDLLPSTGVVT